METHSRKKKNDAKMSEIARHWNLQRVTENKSVLLRGRGGGQSHTARHWEARKESYKGE